MAYDTGFSRRSSSERDLQPVAIVSIDPTSRMAVGATRTRHTIRINCAYATGDTITVPAVGEQWYVERFDAEWRLYGRIPFNDPTLNIEPEEGQVSVGSASGPLELNGTEVRANGTFRLDGVYFRDTGTQFERSTDKKTWTAIGGGTAGVVQIISEALAHYTGTDQALAVAALKSWGGGLDKVAENFTLLWDLLCGNVFVSGLKRLGVGASDVERIIDGFQNFVNYLFGIVFCDFTGDLDPQTLLAKLRDLLAPIISNPFVQGLAAVATALGVGAGNLLNDVVAGLTGLLELMWNILTCQWGKLDLAGLAAVVDLFNADGPFNPATIVSFLTKIFINPVIDLTQDPPVFTPIIGNFLNGLKQVADLITGTLTGQTFDSLLEGAVQGVQDVLQLIYDTVTDILSGNFPTRIADILGVSALITEGFPFSPANLIKSVSEYLILLGSPVLEDGVTVNPVGVLITALGDFWRGIISLNPELVDGGLFKNVIRGIAEMFSILRDLLLVNPLDIESRATFDAAIEKITAGLASATAGMGFPVEIINALGDILTLLIDNPIVLTIQKVFETLGLPTDGMNLLKQIVDGSSNLIYLIGNLITEVILPLDDAVWEALLPFIPASVWNGIRGAILGDASGLLGALSPILKALFKALEDFLALGTDAISNFFQNIVTLFGGLSSFFTVLFADPQEAINYFLTDVIKIAEMGIDGAVTFISDFIGTAAGAVADLITKLLAVFGINFNPVDANGDPVEFNAATALTAFVNKFLVDGLGGIFGATVAEVTRFITRLRNLFGLNLSAFTDIASFDFAAAATGFINAVLVNAPAAAVSVLQGVLDTVTSLAYKVADAVIQAIRGIPFVGNGIADFLKTLLNNTVDFFRGNVNSGTNLLADAGAEKQGFWTNNQTGASYQTGVTYSTAPKRSGGGSLMVSGGNVVWMNVNDLGEVSPIRTQPGEYMHMEAYVYSYYSTTVYLYAKTTNSLDGTTATYYLGSGSANTTWNKVQADVQIPTPWDRVSFGVYAVGYPVYVDDMLVREITASQVISGRLTNLNYALYQNYSDPASGAKINVNAVPSGIPAVNVNSPSGSGTIATDIGTSSGGTGLIGTVFGTSGSGGLVGTNGRVPTLETGVGSKANGTGLNGTVYGTNGVGGLTGTGGTTSTVTTTYNGVYGTGGLVKSLYGSGATSPQTQIAVTALPTTVGAVGSGGMWRRWSSEGATVTTSSYTGVQLPYGFYGHPDVGNTSDLVVQNNGGYMQIKATIEGWYQVDMAFGLSKALIMYQWYFNPVLYKNGSVYKYGNGAANAAYYSYNTLAGLVTSVNSFSLCPEMVQSSFIVYLKVNETIAPGYIWHPDPGDSARSGSPTSATIITTDASGYYTYFSIGLLNRSLA